MKYIVTLFCSLLIAGQAWSQKITNLTANTTPADADLTVVVDDVAGTPTTQKITLATLKTYFQAGLEGDLSDSAGLAAAISDETGTGVVVFSTSPTLVTPVLGAATATDLTLTGQSIYMNSGQTVSIKAGPGSPEGAVTAGIGSLWLATDGTTNTTVWRKESGTGNTGWVAVSAAGSVEGTAVLSTGEVGGTKFLREDGDGTSSWQTISGGGDALVANPLSQFAATTSSQLAGVISDETGSGAAVFGTSPTIATPTITGANMLFSAAAMGALEIDVTKLKNTKSISTASTVTFSATPSTGQIFGATVKNTAITDSVLTIPSSYSEAYNGARTTVTIPASGQVTLTWWYDGSQYNLYGDPVDFFDDIAEDLTPTDITVDSVAYYDAATNAVKRIPIDDFIALSPSSGNFGAAVFEIPNGTSGTTDATGEIYLDTDGDGGTNFSGPVVQIYDGSANKYLFPVALPLAASQNDYILKYDSTGKTVQWEADATGGGGFDSTAVDATTWSDGLNASNIWTFDVSGTDHTMTAGSGIMTFSGAVQANTFVLPEIATPTQIANAGVFFMNTSNIPRFVDEAGSSKALLHATTNAAQDEIVIGASGGGGFVTKTSAKFSTGGTLSIPSGQTIELGAATDTTIARSAAGRITVEGVEVSMTGENVMTPKSTATTYTIGTTDPLELKGGYIIVTAATTITVPTTITTGMNWSVKGNVADAVVVNPDDTHTITLDGVALSAGDSITSTSTLGDLAVFVVTSSTTIDVTTNGWTDTN